MRERSIEKLVADTIESFDGAKRAQPKPFLLTRVMAAVNNTSTVRNVWTRLGAIISRPGIAIGGLVLILFLNIAIFFISKYNTGRSASVQNNSVVKDEFAINASTIYDIENPEQ